MSNYPLAGYHFTVDWGGARMAFTEVSGLTIEHQVIEYREGNARDPHVTKLPGLRRYSPITLKRGIAAGDAEFYHWWNAVGYNKAEKRTLIITLLNEMHEPVMAWRVRNAWPSKIQWPDLKANASEAAIESIELVHEGLELVQ